MWSLCLVSLLTLKGSNLQWMEEQIRRKAEKPQQLKGKRMRGDAGTAVAQRPEVKSFWY